MKRNGRTDDLMKMGQRFLKNQEWSGKSTLTTSKSKVIKASTAASLAGLCGKYMNGSCFIPVCFSSVNCFPQGSRYLFLQWVALLKVIMEKGEGAFMRGGRRTFPVHIPMYFPLLWQIPKERKGQECLRTLRWSFNFLSHPQAQTSHEKIPSTRNTKVLQP